MAAPLPDYCMNTAVYSISFFDCPLISLIAFAMPKAKLPYFTAFLFYRWKLNGAETGICLLFNQLFVRVYVKPAV
jgi:hypothetical protein